MFGKIAKTTTMNPLTFQPILSNLTEAHEELARLFARLQFIVFGEVVEESVKDPFTEEEFGRRMHRIYSDMDYAWTCRTYSKGGGSFSRQAIRRRQQFPRVFLSAIVPKAPGRARKGENASR